MSMLPSYDPLSTTTISSGASARQLLRQARRRSRVFQLTMATAMRLMLRPRSANWTGPEARLYRRLHSPSSPPVGAESAPALGPALTLVRKFAPRKAMGEGQPAVKTVVTLSTSKTQAEAE